VAVVARVARELPVLAGSRGGLRGEVGVARCEMPDTDELQGRKPLVRVDLGERSL
jgi:hypothetical protein